MNTRSEHRRPVAAGGEAVELGELVRRTLLARTDSFVVAGPTTTIVDLPAVLRRRMAAAASSGQRVLSGTYESGCGRITTEVVETEDATLQITVRCTDPSVRLIEFTWSDVGENGVGDRHRLVTPLAPVRGGQAVTYDLGSIADAAAIHLAAAEESPLDRLDPAAVSTAFSVRHTGSARRAWVALVDAGVLRPALVDLLRELLDG